MAVIPFREYCQRVEATLVNYAIPVITRDIPPPLIGDLDGAEIQIDPGIAPEARLFLLAHLFGHTVQWNVDRRTLAIGRPLAPPVPSERLPLLAAYEREAASYGLSLLHESGIQSIDQWFCDYSACDEAYLMHYYRTGHRKEFTDFWRSNSPLFAGRPIPRFTPVRRSLRGNGVVI